MLRTVWIAVQLHVLSWTPLWWSNAGIPIMQTRILHSASRKRALLQLYISICMENVKGIDFGREKKGAQQLCGPGVAKRRALNYAPPNFLGRLRRTKAGKKTEKKRLLLHPGLAKLHALNSAPNGHFLLEFFRRGDPLGCFCVGGT